MVDIKNNIPKNIALANISRRSFLKGAMAVGAALALAGCNQEAVTNTVTNTVTVTEKNTVTVTDTKTVTVTEQIPVETTPPEAPLFAEASNLITTPSVILPNYTDCVGCNRCMIACAFEHYDEPAINKSNIQVYGIAMKGAWLDIPVLCMKCADAPCMAACPDKVAAIYKDEVTGAMKIDHEKCTLCELCVAACAEQKTGCLSIDADEQKVVGMCDLCDGNPQCTLACPEDVLNIYPIGSYGYNTWFDEKPITLAEQVWNLIYRA